LAELFDKGLEYNTITGYRLALSAYHEPIEGVAVGRHHKVSALLAGIHNKRFPRPKYLFIWDVEKVISYLTKLGISDLSDRLLTLKLTMLLALTSAARAHEICFMDVRYLVKHSRLSNSSVFQVTKVCTFATKIDIYLGRTNSCRDQENRAGY